MVRRLLPSTRLRPAQHARRTILTDHEHAAIHEHRRRAVGTAVLGEFSPPGRLARGSVEPLDDSLVAADDDPAVFDRGRRHIGADVLANPDHVAVRNVSRSPAADRRDRAAAGVRRDHEIAGEHRRGNRAEEAVGLGIEPTDPPEFPAGGRVVGRDVIGAKHKEHLGWLTLRAVAGSNERRRIALGRLLGRGHVAVVLPEQFARHAIKGGKI